MMRAVLPRIGGVAGQKKDDRSGKLSLLLVEFKYNTRIRFSKLPHAWPPVRIKEFDFEFSICNENNLL
jgi:hypothetical protein